MRPSIVVPIDTAVFSSNALRLARSLARSSGASVHLVRVDSGPRDDRIGRDPSPHWEAARDGYLDGLASYLSAELGATRVRVSVLEGGDLVERLADFARSRNAVMIVLAANGIPADGYSRGLLTAARLGRECGLPVMLVHPGADAVSHTAQRPRRVIVALAGTEADDDIVTAVQALHTTGDLHCTLVHHMTGARANAGDSEPGRGTLLSPGRRESAAEYLLSRAAPLEIGGCSVDIRISEGPSAIDTISRAIREESPDLLVVGASRRPSRTLPRLGSVASALFRDHEIPIVVVNASRVAGSPPEETPRAAEAELGEPQCA